jgi:hypothetical protein
VSQVAVILAIFVASAFAETIEYQHAIEKRGISGYGGGEWTSGGGDDGGYGGHEEQEVKVVKIPVPKAVPVPVQHPVPVPVPQPYPVHIRVRFRFVLRTQHLVHIPVEPQVRTKIHKNT